MSETEIIVRDIFGDSDESEDEFEGFDADKPKVEDDAGGEVKEKDQDEDEDSDKEQDQDSEKEQPKNEKEKVYFQDSEDDDDNDNDGSGEHQDPQPDEQEKDEEKSKDAIPDLSDSSDESIDDDNNREEKSGIMYDFDIMLQKKKEMNSRNRRRKNVDIINDSDDIVAELIQDMRQAADEDAEANRLRMAATSKLKMLNLVEAQLKKIDLREVLLDSGILGAITDWLTKLPDGSLPHLQIREKLLKILLEFNIDDIDRIKASGIGRAVMYLYKHPKETKNNKRIAGHLISHWSRPIFNLDTDFHSISRDQREKRDFENLARFKRSLSDNNEASTSKIAKTDQKILRPGDKGWVPRARVPMPSMKDYVVRPKSSVEVDMVRISSKKPITRFEKHMRNFREMKKQNKMNRAIPISIEGRKMAL